MAGVAVVKDFDGKKIEGLVSFERGEKWEVKVKAEVKGLEPNKKFGFHVHEFGTCDNKGLMAGGHLNPWKSRHGGPKDKHRHLGDLGNLESNEKGEAVYSKTIKGKAKMFLGRSVIIHAKTDDLKTQQSAGKRIACGIIGAGMPPFTEDTEVVNQAEAQKAGSQKTKPEVQKVGSQKAKPEVEKAGTQKTKPKVEKTGSPKVKPEVQKAGNQKVKSEVQKANSQKAKPKVEKAGSQKTKPKVEKTGSQKTKPEVKKADNPKKKPEVQKADSQKKPTPEKPIN